MEHQLNNEFEKARATGRQITHRWFTRHAKAIYCKLYPHRAVQDPKTSRWQYLGFKFSNSQFQGFCRRFYISICNCIKQAQKSPKELAPVIQKWLQYNCCITVKLSSSDCRKLHNPTVPTVGQFKLSQIANIDQTPLLFENLNSRTYNKKGEKTVWLKEH